MVTDRIRKMPKVELHCHLDGSLSRNFISRRLGREISANELQVPEDCNSLEEYLQKFALPGQCLMDEEGLRQAGYDFLSNLRQENVIYVEVRFAPLLSVTPDMQTGQVIEALLKGLNQGRAEYGIDYNVITCAMRNHSQEENLAMLETARDYLGSGVCAADLAGAEAAYPMSEFMELFGKVKKMGMPFTIHAGECGSAVNIRDAIEAGASRIGHGIAMRGNEALQQLCRDRHIGIEMCPISNLQTKAVRSSAEYPLREFLDSGLLVSVNTDNRTVSNSSLTRELAFIQETYGIADEELALLMENAVDTAFVDEAYKDSLHERIRMGAKSGEI